MSIESVLGLSPEEVERRLQEEKRKIPTVPGTGYLEQKFFRFRTPEWQFLSYIAHYNPPLLHQLLEEYAGYDGNESRAVVLEGLREEYIIGKLMLTLRPTTNNPVIHSEV